MGSVGVIVLCFLGIVTDILPHANSHQFQLRLSVQDGTRVERTELATLKVLDIIKSTVGEENVAISSAYVGTVPSSLSLIHI